MSNVRASILMLTAAAFGGLLAVGLLIFVAGYFFMNQGELGDKEKYALLQTVEVKNRNEIVPTDLILKRNAEGTKFDILGIPTGDDKYPMTWVLLNGVDYKDGVISLPPAMPMKKRCEQLLALFKAVDVRSEVRLHLITKMQCGSSPSDKK